MDRRWPRYRIAVPGPPCWVGTHLPGGSLSGVDTLSFVLPCGGHGTKLVFVGARVVSAEEQLPTGGFEDDSYIGLRTACITAVGRVQLWGLERGVHGILLQLRLQLADRSAAAGRCPRARAGRLEWGSTFRVRTYNHAPLRFHPSAMVFSPTAHELPGARHRPCAAQRPRRTGAAPPRSITVNWSVPGSWMDSASRSTSRRCQEYRQQ